MVNNFYWLYNNVIDKKTCEYLVSSIDWSDATDGAVGDEQGYKVNEMKRKTKVVWKEPMSVFGCIAATYILNANKSADWNFNLTHMNSVQVGKYSEGSFYDWHNDLKIDKNNDDQRKLSLSLVLSDPSDYEGGDLELSGATEQPKIGQGSIIVFPSLIDHRVTPVTKGTRYSMVAWMHGPAFR
jgi:PKHD-type hydroxylase